MKEVKLTDGEATGTSTGYPGGEKLNEELISRSAWLSEKTHHKFERGVGLASYSTTS